MAGEEVAATAAEASSLAIVSALENVIMWICYGIIAIIALMCIAGLIDVIYVFAKGLSKGEEVEELRPLFKPEAFIHLLSHVLLIIVAIELTDTVFAYVAKAGLVAYIGGVIGAALVAVCRKVILMYHPPEHETTYKDMIGYAVIIAVLAAVLWLLAKIMPGLASFSI